MYALVLMSAMTPGADVTPAPAPRPAVLMAPAAYGCSGAGFGCTGCTGYGVAYGSCYGSCHGHGGGLFGHHRSCHGCAGYNCAGYNCFGSGYGYGGYAGYYGSTWGPPIGMPPYTLQGYNQGGVYGYGPPVVYTDPIAVYGRVTNVNPPTVVTVPAETTKPMEKPSSDTKPTDKPKGMGASVKFKLPADAKLFVDGRPTALGGAERAFTTPPLTPGQKYFYDVRAELPLVTGVVVEEKRVVVESGADITESFPKLLTAAGK